MKQILRNYNFANLLIHIMLFLGVLNLANAQSKFCLGISGVYNFPTQSIGFGVRAQIPIYKRLEVVPQFKYLPDFNPIAEYYGGVNLHYNVIEKDNVSVYAAAGALYNRWINYTLTENSKSGKNNFIPEAGVGVSIGGEAIRGFAEVKYNILWNESYTEIGILLYLGALFQTHKICPTYY